MYKIRYFEATGWNVEIRPGIYRPMRNMRGWCWDYRA